MSDFYVVAFTGHRGLTDTQVSEAAQLINAYLLEMRALHGDRLRVIQGMADGIDQLAGCYAHLLGIPYCAAIPHARYPEVYKLRAEEFKAQRWDDLIAGAHEVVYCFPEDQPWKPSMNFGRNNWMIQHADEVCAVTYWEPKDVSVSTRPRGGTAHAIQEALKKEKTLRWLQLHRE